MHDTLAPREITASLDRMVAEAKLAGLSNVAIRGKLLVEMPELERAMLVQGYGSLKTAITRSLERLSKRGKTSKSRALGLPKGLAGVPDEVRKAISIKGGKATAEVRREMARSGEKGRFLTKVDPDRADQLDASVEFIIREVGPCDLDKILGLLSLGDWQDIVAAYHTLRLAVRSSLMRLKYRKLVVFEEGSWKGC